MDFDPKHDLSLNLPLSFPGDDSDAQPADTVAERYQLQQTQQTQQQQQQRLSPVPRSGAEGKVPETSPEPPTFTVYIRAPGPRNGFVDPPDIDWSREKDDALWKILSGVSQNDIDWQDLAHRFNATVEFLIVQATVLAERQVSQVRAQTRKVASLGARDSPIPSPMFAPGDRPPSVAGATASRITSARAATPTLASETMARTLSTGGTGMRRTPSGGGANTNAAPRVSSGGSGSSRPQSVALDAFPAGSVQSFQTVRIPAVPVEGRFTRARSRLAAIATDAKRAPTPDEPEPAARPTSDRNRHHHHHHTYDSEDVDALSPVATTSQSSSGSDSESSTPSQPVMSRIFKRPPGYPQQDDLDVRGSTATARAAGRGTTGRFGAAPNLDITSPDSAGSDGGDESETQAAFLPFKSPTLAATISGRPAMRMQRAKQQQSTSPVSSSASASPTGKAFRSAAATAAGMRGVGQTGAASGSAASAASSPAAAARLLYPSRLPLMRVSSSTPHHNRNLSAGQSPGAARRSGYSREGSEIGTTPSMGSSFSDLDDVSLTQSVLDEALASRVEDTSSLRSETQSSSTNMATSSSTMSRRLR